MQRELLILRHGKAERPGEHDDFDRSITDRGKRSAQRVATWLARAGRLPDHVVSSPAERAIESARKACKAMGLNGGDVHGDPRLYGATVEQLLEVLGECPTTARRVMLVGHNPGLEQLLEHLCGAPPAVPEGARLLPTAALACLGMPGAWQGLTRGSAVLEELVRPATLPKKFPFPDPHSDELRDRPAYYYRQSSVIPFRNSDGAIQVLVIASSQKKHCVVPKGIHDPGMSAEDSAAKEAWEEAGVEGEVLNDSLGSYVYDKWGASCTVTVYPMRVTRVLPDTEWKERHRGREWVAPHEAASRLKQQSLAPMLQELVRRYG